MPRKVKEEDFNIKRNQILDSALKFIYSIGYEQMSIQNILDDLSISKGAFYHYFGSKEDLLIGIIDRLSEQIYIQINPIADDEQLTGLQKMNAYFKKAGMLKMEHIDLLMPIIRVWYIDENLMVREKLTNQSCQMIAPILARFVRQGIDEGDFKNSYSDLIGEVIYRVFLDMANSVTDLLLVDHMEDFDEAKFDDHMRVYTRVIENILGAQPGSVVIISDGIMKEWKAAFVKGLAANPVQMAG
jgi:AcrR family transcriptional regulator